MEEIKENIRRVWSEINEEFNLPNALVSSEKSIIFKFAWKYYERFGETIQAIDFETCLFEDFPDGKFLDLYMLLIENGIEFKVGLEFKFPKQSKTKSNHSQTRQKIINDLKRINILVQNHRIHLGCFLCLTNENNYLNEGRFTVAPDCLTNHGMTYRAGDLLPQTNNFDLSVHTTNDITFIWSEIHLVRNKFRINLGTKYTSIQPIFVNG